MSKYRKANRSLGQQPKVINLIPADLAMPMIGVIAASILAYAWFEVPPLYCFGIAIWLSASWWIFAGDKPWLQISKLTIKTPFWGTAQSKYQAPQENIRPYKKRK